MALSLVSTSIDYIKLNNASLQNVGHCCYNFDSITKRNNIDGIMLINLNDIISAKWVGSFLKRSPFHLGPIHPEWHIISSDEYGKTNPDFNIQTVVSKLKEISDRNIELILYLDISDQINHTFRTSPTEYIFSQFIINIGYIFTGIVYEFNKYLTQSQYQSQLGLAPLSFSYIACMQKDGFQLRDTGLKPFIISYIMSSVNYISKNFTSNIYLTGLKHQISCKNMAHHTNSNILACLANNYKFISMRHLYILKTDKLPLNTDSYTYKSEVTILMKYINDKKNELIDVIKSVKSQAKQTIEKIINVNDTASNIIIGINLDMVFDLQIYDGIKYILDNLKYNPPPTERKKTTPSLNPFAPIFNGADNSHTTTANSENTSSNTINKIEDDGSGVTVEFKLINILDLMSNGSIISDTPNINSLFGTNAGAQKKSVCVSYIPVNIPDSELVTNIQSNSQSNLLQNIVKDIDMFVSVISKSKLQNSKKLFVLVGNNLTFDYFKKIITYIADQKQIHQCSNYKSFESKYINFEINPYLRCCLGYYNYMTIANNITLTTSILGASESYYIKNAKHYACFYKYFNRIRGNINVSAHTNTNTNTNTNCCTCCKCLSRFGTEYHEYKYIPYLGDDAITLLESSTDIWIPRI